MLTSSKMVRKEVVLYRDRAYLLRYIFPSRRRDGGFGEV